MLDGGEQSVQELAALYEANRYIDAHQRAEQLGFYGRSDVPARLLSGRLVAILGDRRRSRAYHFYTFRKNPAHPDAAYYYAGSCKGHSPYFRLGLIARVSPLTGASPQTLSHWLALKAGAYGELRDFERARAEMKAAKDIHVDPWVLTEEADLLADEDEREQGLAVIQEALRMNPVYRPALHVAAMLLAELDRMDQAIALLAERVGDVRGEPAGTAMQCGPLWSQLAHYQSEAGAHRDARASLQKALVLQPLLPAEDREHIRVRAAELAYLAGDRALAIEEARGIDGKRGRELLEQLSRDGKRVQVPIAFVRQHHMTCAPATLAAICAHWKVGVDHELLANEICYGGTSSHGERAWASRNDLIARELTITLESAQALIDRGVPFTLTTVEPTSAHLQAVFGYDTLLGRILVRDPSLRHAAEYDVALIEHYRSCGPRGMTLLPKSEAQRLDGVALPDVELYDQLYELQCALEAHDRVKARAIVDAMHAAAPGHRLTWDAEWQLAAYDQDATTRLRAIKELLKLFPDDARLGLSCFQALREVGSHAEVIAFLESITKKRKVVPALWQAHADQLRLDTRSRVAARTLLRTAIRAVPGDPTSYHILADTLYEERRYEDAAELYRIAACMSDTNEHYAIEYFYAARLLKRTEDALAFLRRRAERYVSRSGAPAQTFFTATEAIDRSDEGFAQLERALAARPNDGELLLFCARTKARYGQGGAAAELLERSRGHAREADRMATRATIAQALGDPEAALAAWRDVVQLEPLNLYAVRRVALGLCLQHGDAAGLAFLAEHRTRFPEHGALLRLIYEVAETRDPKAAEEALRRAIEVTPYDTWALRELGFFLIAQGRTAEAGELVAELKRRGSTTHAGLGLAGRVALNQGDVVAARAAFRAAIAIDVDYGYAIDGLLEACSELEERRAALDFVRSELVRQVTFGQGIHAFRRRAHGVLDPAEVAQVLRDALAARPDLVDAYAALCNEHIDHNQLEEAREVAERAVARFPATEDTWLTLARVHDMRGDRAAQRATLERGHERLPGSGALVRQLATELVENPSAGDVQRARDLVEPLTRRDPNDARAQGVLALVLWKADARAEALARLEHAVVLEPDYPWAWDRLGEWGSVTGQTGAAIHAAEKLAAQRPFDASAHQRVGELLMGEGQLERALLALDKAAHADARDARTHDMRAEVLVRLERFDDALAATRPAAFRGVVPVELRGRRAWVIAKRGHTHDAIAEMREVIADYPDYRWGYRQLSDWCEAVDDRKGQAEASEHMVRLSPHNPVARGYLADALLTLGQRARAKQHLARAIELDPDYRFAATKYFDLCFEDGELEAARKALELLPGGADVAVARRVALETKVGALDAARAAFAALLRLEQAGDWALGHAAEALEGAQHHTVVTEVLHAALSDKDAKPAGNQLWTARNRERVAHALKEASKLELGPFGVAAIVSLIEVAGERTPEGQRALRAVRRNKKWLRRYTPTWGSVAYALMANDRYRECARWMRDYRQHEQAEPWMLQNLASALRWLGRDTQAVSVARHALTRPADHTRLSHALWVALDDALAGQHEAARALLNEARDASLSVAQANVQALATIALWATRSTRRARAPYRDVLAVRARLMDADRRAGGRADLAPPNVRARRRVQRAIALGRPLWQQLWIRMAW